MSCDQRQKHEVALTLSSGRPDLIEQFAKRHSNLRFAMAGADNGMLLAAMRAGAKKFQEITARVGSAPNGQ
jgi:hypothetical protein